MRTLAWTTAAAALASCLLTGCEINRRESPLAALETTEPERTEPAVTVAQLGPPLADSALTWEVVDVLDGGTLRLTALGNTVDVRLLGVLVPATGACDAGAAIDGLRFFTADPRVRVMPGTAPPDPEGRIVRHVDTVDGVDLGAELVRAGFLAVDTAAETPRRGLYETLEQAARLDERGRWAPGTC